MTLEARVQVELGAGSGPATAYEIVVGEGVYTTLPALLDERVRAHRYVVIADDRVAGLHGDAVLSRVRATGRPVDLLVFPAGEVSKTRDVWADLSDRMLGSGHGRDSAVLALGGGVTGDLAGFVAATYLRGLPLVQLPTTLLAMIDSSVGGKTGVDTAAGKNLIGAFHQPRFVLADTRTLETLPAAEVRSGAAEAIKHGAIADESYFAWIRREADPVLALDPAAAVDLIRRSVEIKAGVVAADEREGGLRKTLNFGHTIGHAVEALSAFRLLHGEAIAIGMVMEARLGEALGITDPGTAEQLAAVLRAFGLPVAPPSEQDPAAILELTRVDKKARAGVVEYALIERIGRASRGSGAYGTAVDDAVVLGVLGAVAG